ncbi:MAG: c-type cytochrome biogenesis protein CcmI [Marinovum sp.]|nr:c-type cytochrome biogenesis protein CcmI [Marinovum sp.]
MIFWAVTIALSAMAVLLVLMPLWRGGASTTNRKDGALAIFADQVAEVDREAKAGLLTDQEAEAAKVEIKRRMLVASRTEDDALRGGGRAVLIAGAFCVPFAAVGLYAYLGSPGTPSQPFAERSAERDGLAREVALVRELRERLLAQPDGGETKGWVLLARAYMRLDQPGDAALAFARVADREDVSSGILTQYAEALITAEQGVVTNRTVLILERALGLDPDNPAGTYYYAQWLLQEGREEEAEARLAQRIAKESVTQPWIPFFLNALNGLRADRGVPPLELEDVLGAAVSEDRPGPDAADMAAAAEMSEEDRAAMIRGMVDGLAARLNDTPEDVDGWIRLAQARFVLQEEDAAREAFLRARELLAAAPEDDPRKQAVVRALQQLGFE